MGSFQSWTSWIALRETNARKRAVKAALQGTGPKLPGSYAACPSTNPMAMNVAADSGEVRKAPKSMWKKYKEGHIARPDYSLDRWISSAKELGDDVNSLVHSAKEDEEKLDKDKDQKAKEPKPEETPEPKEPKQDAEDKDQEKKPETPEQKKAWTQLRKIHKDRMPNFKKPEDKSKAKPETKSSAKPSATSSKRSSK